MESWVDVAAAIRSADPAGLLTDRDVDAAVAAVQAQLNTWTFVWTGPCPGCGHVPPLVHPLSRKATVLDVDGLHQAKHTPRRCRRRDCPQAHQYLWHNFRIVGRKHLEWISSAKQLPSVIMMTQGFGVTRRWYEQFSKRLLVHMSSFWGEAKVHWRRGFSLSFHRLKLKLTDAWFKIRLVQRCWQMGRQPPRLSARKDDAIRRLVEPYNEFMLQLRRRQVGSAEEPLTGLVIDGHVKAGARRRCGVASVAAVRCKPLSAWCLTVCPRTPGYKNQRCKWHQRCLAAYNAGDKTIHTVSRLTSLAQSSDDLLRIELECPHGTVEAKALSELTAAQNTQLQGYLTAAHAAKTAAAPEGPVFSDEMTLQELLDIQCQTHKQGPTTGKGNRAGGLLVACRSDGLIVHLQEYQGPEALSQRYAFLAHCKSVYNDLRVVVHDDACHLRRYATNRPSSCLRFTMPVPISLLYK